MTDLTKKICQALQEVKLMREGKIKEPSMDEILASLDDSVTQSKKCKV